MRRYALLILFFLSLTPSGARAGERETLTVAADSWCPINCAPGDELEGVGVDVARKIFESLGYEVRYVAIPWSRALEEARLGRIDAVVGANQYDDETLLRPKNPVYQVTDDFYVLNDAPIVFKNMASLKGLRLGIIADYGYTKETQRLIAIAKKTPGMAQLVGGDDALEQNIKKLIAGRIDVIIESGAVMDYKLRAMDMAGTIKRIGGVGPQPVYVAFSPALAQSPRRILEYDAGVEKLRATGELRAMYAVYGLVP